MLPRVLVCGRARVPLVRRVVSALGAMRHLAELERGARRGADDDGGTVARPSMTPLMRLTVRFWPVARPRGVDRTDVER